MDIQITEELEKVKKLSRGLGQMDVLEDVLAMLMKHKGALSIDLATDFLAIIKKYEPK